MNKYKNCGGFPQSFADAMMIMTPCRHDGGSHVQLTAVSPEHEKMGPGQRRTKDNVGQHLRAMFGRKWR